MSKKQRLSQAVAIAAGAIDPFKKATTSIHKATQKRDLYEGSKATYQPLDEENGERLPPEGLIIRLKAEGALAEYGRLWSEIVDIIATRDVGNTVEDARAHVVIDGQTLTTEPLLVFLLIFLENQAVDVRKAIDVIPTLDEAIEWSWDDNQKVWRSKEPTTTHRTKKVENVIRVFDPTEHQPGQFHVATQDIFVGYWTKTRFSGALSVGRKQELLTRVTKLINALKVAREEANSAHVDRVEIGQTIIGYVLDGPIK